MRQRCTNPRHPNYALWGGRGIAVCARWNESFAAFLADVGERPSGPQRLTLERIDNNRDYEPGNVKWATYSQQGRNKRGNRIVEWNGTSRCLSDWALHLGINRATLDGRLRRGWAVDLAFTLHP